MATKDFRQQLGAELDALDGVKAVSYADDITPEPTLAVAIVYVAELGPTDVMPTVALLQKLSVIVAVAKQEPGVADDQLDDLLDQVLAVLDDHKALVWTKATRSVYLETYPSYVIDVEARAK